MLPVTRNLAQFRYNCSEEFFKKIPEHTALIGLDIGSKRTGIACSDRTLRHAIQICTMEFGDNRSIDPTIERKFTALFRKSNTCGLIVGNPIGLDGLESRQAQITKVILAELLSKYKIEHLPILFKDERFSTQHVTNRYGVTPDRDELTACLLLQEYLDFRWAKVNPGG